MHYATHIDEMICGSKIISPLNPTFRVVANYNSAIHSDQRRALSDLIRLNHSLFDLFEEPHFAFLRNNNEMVGLSTCFVAESDAGVLDCDAL